MSDGPDMDPGALLNWWTDTPGVSGYLRFAFYAGLLVLCLVDRPTPLMAPKIRSRVDECFYTPGIVARRLGIARLSPRALTRIRSLTIVCWVLAALGVAQPISGAATFVGYAVLHAANAGALAGNHSNHAALYSLFAMSFSASNPSLDQLLIEAGWWPSRLGPSGLLGSGLALKLALVLMVYLMFGAGVSKIRYGWRGWRSGRALGFYLRESQRFARVPGLSRWVVRRPLILAVAAWATMLTETGSISVIFLPAARIPFVAAWILLHMAIYLLMFPAYYIQSWCYLLIVWPAVGAAGEAGSPASAAASSSSVAASVVGYTVVVVLAAGLIKGSEEWPLTAMPMYSNGTVRPNDVEPNAVEGLCTRARKAVAGRHRAWCRPWVDGEVIQDIWLRPADRSVAPTRLFEEAGGNGTISVRWSQYVKVVREATINDLAARDEPTQPSRRGSDTEALLSQIAARLRAGLPDWRRHDAVELCCDLGTQRLVLASVALDSAPAQSGVENANNRGA